MTQTTSELYDELVNKVRQYEMYISTKTLLNNIKHMENKQTAVEWLLGTLEQNDIIDLDSVDSNKYYDIINQAKQMEKEQVERMYSEEDMIDFAMFYYTHQGKATKYWGKDLFKEWYREQLKQKL